MVAMCTKYVVLPKGETWAPSPSRASPVAARGSSAAKNETVDLPIWPWPSRGLLGDAQRRGECGPHCPQKRGQPKGAAPLGRGGVRHAKGCEAVPKGDERFARTCRTPTPPAGERPTHATNTNCKQNSEWP